MANSLHSLPIKFAAIARWPAISGIKGQMRVEKIKGEVNWLWRAVDQEGQVLDILMHKRRNTRSAKKFFRRIIRKADFAPKVVVTDKLKSYSLGDEGIAVKAKSQTAQGVE